MEEYMDASPDAGDRGARVGRPRTFDDADIFEATARIVGRVGSQLTLATVAAEVGCTGQALYKRFGSKRNLLLAFADWLNAISAERYRQARSEHGSPLAALYARVLMPAETRPDELHNPSTLAQSLTFCLESIADEAFRVKWEQRDRMLSAELSRLLAAAQNAGELDPQADPQALGESLHLALMGAALVGSWRQGETVAERFRTVLETVLGPHHIDR
jgi:AcrR family transcriptional regulator